MNWLVFCGSVLLLLVVLVGALRTVLERHFPFSHKFEEDTRSAYVMLAIAGAVLLVLSIIDYRRIQTIEVAGVKASLGELSQKVDTLADRLEEFYQSEKTEMFDERNWNRVKTLERFDSGSGPGSGGYILEIELEQPPIPGSVRVFEGILLFPQRSYHVDGKRLTFSSNINEVSADTLTVYYHPRTAKPGATPMPQHGSK